MANRHMYLLTLEVLPLEVGAVYDNLPSHCTLVHRFWSEFDYAQLSDTLQPILCTTYAVPLFFEGKDTFGPPPVVVNRIRTTSELKKLHNRLYRELNDSGVEYTAPQWVGYGYKAHITERPGISFNKGSCHMSRATYLIEVMVPGNEKARFVRTKFALRDS